MRILLVDDETDLVATLTERLAIRGIHADWASSGEEALRRIETETYDLAVLDVKMPRIGGIQLKKAMEEKSPDMKFIFLTGHGSDADFRKGAAEAGAAFYLVKPIRIEVLIQKMKEALGMQGDP